MIKTLQLTDEKFSKIFNSVQKKCEGCWLRGFELVAERYKYIEVHVARQYVKNNNGGGVWKGGRGFCLKEVVSPPLGEAV